MAYAPDEFAFRASSLCDPELARWWSRANLKDYIAGSSNALVNAAFAALTHWSDVAFAGPMSLQMQGIQGTIVTIARCIVETENRRYELTRQFGALFRSQNIGVAFTAVRQFDAHTLSFKSMFVIDHLVKVASAPEVPVSPSAMSLRAIAFKVLFDLDPNFRTFPSLATAYEECIFGCRAWALDGRQDYRDTLQKLLQYHAATK